MTTKNIRFFNLAKRMAEMSEYARAPTGCVAVYKNKVVATGVNQLKTSPLQARYNKYRKFDKGNGVYIKPAIHAEMHCLAQLMHMDVPVHKVEFYVYRACRSREHGTARPCPACMMALKEFGIQKVYYTTDSGFCYESIA